ncbi:GAF domain-containing SpoIIE family protein phosphatase [Actinomadura sp. 7K507]|uniref:PP2C family protein-serine/threonine phosphatase n=1 Tax=Actinomadura sp. 7K507 TaxID=2530365 RepID=UPI00105368FF|nr:GAF domain-containing SpoIIE family protein phosphatase [Actinomadura sp. 7K507]TDC84024.1 GAF domain-containing protein [Actinomadura sp. 7K507]
MDDYDVDAALQRALDRLTLLNDTATALVGTLDAVEGLRRVCRILVPQLADWCVADLVNQTGTVERVCITHMDREATLAGLLGPLPTLPESTVGPLSRVLSGARAMLLSAADVLTPGQSTDPFHAHNLKLFSQLGVGSMIVAPLRTRWQVLGALTVVRTADRPPLAEEDLALVEDLAHRIGLALDNARLHHETQRIAERLQLSLLPDLPDAGDLQIAARYAPAATTAEVGGDWYDSFLLPQGDTTLIIGDVTGHDLRAAVTMSHLRNMLRGIACDRQEPPGHILRRLDAAINALYDEITATCVYALISGPQRGPWQMHWALAGHPPPLLITPEGDTSYLDDALGPLLGVDAGPRISTTRALPAGSTILLYTDGLIERRSEPLYQGLTRLRQHATALARHPLENLCDQLLDSMAAESTDDVALLALRLPSPGATPDNPNTGANGTGMADIADPRHTPDIAQ